MPENTGIRSFPISGQSITDYLNKFWYKDLPAAAGTAAKYTYGLPWYMLPEEARDKIRQVGMENYIEPVAGAVRDVGRGAADLAGELTGRPHWFSARTFQPPLGETPPAMRAADDEYTLPTNRLTSEATADSPAVPSTPIATEGDSFWDRVYESGAGDVLTRFGLDLARGQRGGFTGTLQNVAEAGVGAQEYAGKLRSEKRADRQTAAYERMVDAQVANVEAAKLKAIAQAVKDKRELDLNYIEAAAKLFGEMATVNFQLAADVDKAAEFILNIAESFKTGGGIADRGSVTDTNARRITPADLAATGIRFGNK